MAKIDSITIKGFKSIACIEDLKLGAINVIIGANGSGKSNFIGVFSFLHAIIEMRLDEYVRQAGGAEKVLFFGAKVTQELSITINSQKPYGIKLQATNNDQLMMKPESSSFYFISGIRDIKYYVNGRVSVNDDQRFISEQEYSDKFRGQIDNWRVYHFHDAGTTSPMKKTADVDDNRYLRADGANIAAFLYLLREKHLESYKMIRRSVQLVAPFFDDFMLEPQALNPNKIRLEWKHKKSDAYFDASSLSDGTLRFIALATLFLQPESTRPSVILVDEPELGLHPYAITIFASMVKEAAVNSQVILSTQSPQLLDNFEPEDVLVANQVDGATEITRLHPERLALWLEDYSLGQLWEKNELGGRPGGE
ncbi:MAG: AAA family ATPase [bacterium]